MSRNEWRPASWLSASATNLFQRVMERSLRRVMGLRQAVEFVSRDQFQELAEHGRLRTQGLVLRCDSMSYWHFHCITTGSEPSLTFAICGIAVSLTPLIPFTFVIRGSLAVLAP